ncbi:uncharacterized protein LOC131149044 [Malania oleifera]|uniref:uncharacterized protein LOC131149044 n=1 Tax=Malania oleifera TaxID=397392 RepID=UPI0025AE32D1|nr:uncharacterized protein LOC131149044 [Malania oleifera]
MAAVCISRWIEEGAPSGPPFRSVYRWPESCTESGKAAAATNVRRGGGLHRPPGAVVDGISCRQMYLRSYSFSRKETVQEKTARCAGRVRERLRTLFRRSRRRKCCGRRKKRCFVLRKAKTVLSAAWFSIFRRLLSCTAQVDVAGDSTE